MIQTAPRQWIKEINEVIKEYDLLSNQLSNAILNDSHLTIKQLQRFEVWEDKARQINITAPDFYSFLNDQSIDQAKSNHADLKFQLSQTLNSLRSEEFAQIKSKKHEFRIKTLRNLNRLLWGAIKKKQFEVDKDYQLRLNADVDDIDSTGKYIKTETLPPQRTETKTEQVQPTFKNNFDRIEPTEIYKHFKAGLVEKGYLTEQELNEYLKAAFELKTKPETLFKIKDAPSKEKIYVVFYTYYSNVAGKQHGKQSQYVELLGNYFDGYNNNIIRTNWKRGYKQKKH